MKIINHFLLVLLFFCINASAQTTEKLANAKIQQLKSFGVDTVLIYGYGCSGCVFTFDGTVPCQTVDYLCLVWSDKKHNYIQRIDTCYQYEPVVDEMGDVIDLLRKHLSEIVKEEIKEPTFKINEDGKEVESNLITDHYTYNTYVINVSGQSYRKEVSDFDLNTKSYIFSGKTLTNINDDYNQHTQLRLLHNLVGKKNTALGKRILNIKK